MFVEGQVSGVNLPFNLLQNPCVEGVGNGENRPKEENHSSAMNDSFTL